MTEALSRRREHLGSNWNYTEDDEGEEDVEDEDDDVDEDDFMEVSDAISGKSSAFLPPTPVTETSIMTSSSGKRSTATACTDGESGNFSDEGLSTVRRVVQQQQQPKETDLIRGSGPPLMSSFSAAQVSRWF